MKTRWICEQANAWYEKMGWMRGCNFIGSDRTNRLDMFQSYKIELIEGFNTLAKGEGR